MPLPHQVPVATYKDPWDISLTERLRYLTKGETRVAYFYERADNSTFRYRVYNMAQVLNHCCPGVSSSYFFLDDLYRLEEIAQLASLLVICRTRYDNRINHLITAFRQHGKRVFFDVDDLVFDTDYVHLILSTLDQDLSNPQLWQDWFSYVSRIGATLKLSDAAIATNAYLAARISEFIDIPVSIIPNFLNKEQLEISEKIRFRRTSNESDSNSETISLGYFSGTPSHNKDYGLVVPALEEIMEADERVELVVAGYIEAGPVLERFGKRVKWLPFQDFVNLQRHLATVHINLMPLQTNVFTNCKSELKYFEAAVVGTQSIASPSFTYARAIRHRDNGYLAQVHQWTSVLQEAIADIDNGRFKEMAIRSFNDAREKYGWLNQAKVILKALGLSEHNVREIASQ